MNALTMIKHFAPLQKVTSQLVRLQLVIGDRCAAGPAGRVLLHLLCACGDHQVRWHMRGIARELAGQFALLQ